MRLCLILSITALLLSSCQESKTGKKNAHEIPKIEIIPGKIIPSVSLLSDLSQSFALYLPSTYSTTGQYPAIIFFDPHGDGSLPLHLYDSLAEKYGFILIGSNNSRNGLSFGQTNDIASKLLSDVKTRFAIDPARIAVCGFSGGAKVALAFASITPEVSYVIYTGAATEITPHKNLKLLGFAGLRDMNYSDLVTFHHRFDQSSVPHFLVEWKGKHEFPAAAIFEDALIFMLKGEIPSYEKKQVSIRPEDLTSEQDLKQKYYDAFTTRELAWWEDEIRYLQSMKSNNLMYERVLGFISLACYSYAGQAIQQGRTDFAEYILTIYRLADPDNKDLEKFTKELEKVKAG